jgi:ceramide glucosyltransferase
MSASLLEIGAHLCLGWSAIVAAVSLEAVRRSLSRKRPASAMAAPPPRVLVVRPCAGDEPGLAHNLRSLALAPRSFELRCRLAVADRRDAAWPIAERAAEALRAEGLDVEVVLTAARGPNRKVSQIHHVLSAERAPFDLLLVADSDLDLTAAALDLLVTPLTGPSPRSAVWAPPAEHAAAQTAGDRASIALLGASLHAFPLLAGLDRRGLVGKLFAVRRDVLDDLGGFGALVDHLGEDMELGRRILARGGTIEDAPLVARSMASGRSMEQAVARFARWLLVIRAQRPWLLPSYPFLFFATPLIVVLALLTAPAAPQIAFAAALLALVSRLGVALAAARASGRPVGLGSALREALRGDLLLARAFARALGSRRFSWRGTALTIERGGVLREGG